MSKDRKEPQPVRQPPPPPPKDIPAHDSPDKTHSNEPPRDVTPPRKND